MADLTEYKKKEIGEELGRMARRLQEITNELGLFYIDVSQYGVYLYYEKGIGATCYLLDEEYGDDEFENILVKQPTVANDVLIDELEEASKKWGFEFPLNNGEVK